MPTIDAIWLQQQFPDLQNLRSLTVGGQKFVFHATHSREGDVALKIIHPHQDPEATRREISAAGQLSHCKVPKILETGILPTTIGDCVWIREQFISGERVRDLVRSGPIPIEKVLKLGRDVLATLAEAERIRIVHRDVKPENLICDEADSSWLLDFGISRHLDAPTLTATGPMFGKYTAGYAPREQFQNARAEIDGRSDLFAAGVTMYECATGVNPFWAGTTDPNEVLRRVETQRLPQLNIRLRSGSSFADLIAAMTQPQRNHRPSSVAEAHQWINEICTQEGL